MAQIQHSFSQNDEYYTPACAVYLIISYLKPEAAVWCPFDTEESQYVKILLGNGFLSSTDTYGQDRIFLRFLCRNVTISSATHPIV